MVKKIIRAKLGEGLPITHGAIIELGDGVDLEFNILTTFVDEINLREFSGKDQTELEANVMDKLAEIWRKTLEDAGHENYEAANILINESIPVGFKPPKWDISPSSTTKIHYIVPIISINDTQYVAQTSNDSKVLSNSLNKGLGVIAYLDFPATFVG